MRLGYVKKNIGLHVTKPTSDVFHVIQPIFNLVQGRVIYTRNLIFLLITVPVKILFVCV